MITGTTSTASGSDLFPGSRIAPTAALLAASLAVRDAFEHVVNRPMGLDREVADLIVRISLAGEAGLRGVDCARQLHVSATQVSRLADRAESAELVERKPDPYDRRAQRLLLTQIGEQTARTLAPLVDAAIQAMIFDEFDARERAALISLLDRLTKQASRLVETATP